MDFSLFYFADDGQSGSDRYRLLLDGARFADAHAFTAVWTPERHFDRFGGLFPNPSVAAAAVAAVTERVGIRAGSVVMPLHHPLRVAEEWSMVDNLSGGRVGISLASGWNPRDFVFDPGAYADRRERTIAAVDTLRGLWRGEPFRSGRDGGEVEEYRIYPPPVQAELPLWLTSSGRIETFEAAGKAGVGVLTNLLSYGLDELAGRVAAYRAAFAASGLPGRGHVVLMMHTYLDDDLDAADRRVREPLERYLTSALALNLRASTLGGPAARSAPAGPDDGRSARRDEARSRLVVRGAYERYLHRDGLFGAVEDVLPIVERVGAADVDEIACLIDFGVPTEAALRGLELLERLRRTAG